MSETKNDNLTAAEKLFLAVMKNSLKGELTSFDDSVAVQDVFDLLILATKQNVLPMVYEGIYRNAVFNELPDEDMQVFRNQVVGTVTGQMRRTSEFLTLYKHLEENGLRPLVVKGIICRDLYPDPDIRPSSDEDLYVPEDQFDACREVMEKEGLQITEYSAAAAEDSYEVSFISRNMLLIELHRGLFGKGDAYSGMNELFDGVFDEAVGVDVNGQEVYTMPPTKHMLFLILHAYKHFLSGGFGLRQVCDMSLFANAYGSEIDWDEVFASCGSVHGEVFALSLFEICIEYLGMDMEKACYKEEYRKKAQDPCDLLKDILDAGIYGSADMDRKHSSTMTIKAVEDNRSGEEIRNHN